MNSAHASNYDKPKLALVQFRTVTNSDGIKRCSCYFASAVHAQHDHDSACDCGRFIPSGFGLVRNCTSATKIKSQTSV